MAAQPHRPQIDRTQAAALAETHWGLTGELRELGSYADRNYLITCASGLRRVLKFSALTFEAREVVEMQIEALVHLGTRASASVVPHPVPSCSGAVLVEIEDLAGEPCTARVLSWIEGPLWSDLDADTLGSPRGAALRRSLGRALAQLALDLADFEHPGMHRSLRWNLCEAAWIADALEQLPAGPRRELVTDTLAEFQAHVLPHLPELPHALIHGDANDQNLIVGAEALVGLIDFGDAVAAPPICDLAVAIAYTGMIEDPLAGLAEVCAGYTQLRPLSPLELALLFDLVRTRLAVSVVCSAQAHAAEPDNTYVTASQAPAWSLLERLTSLGRVCVSEAIARACGQAPPR